MAVKREPMIGPMLASRRCGARTRKETPCLAPAVAGKRRCRMHGGATGSGAPKGNKNALKHGLYTKEAIAERRYLRELIKSSRQTLAELS
jgi:uncharacterized protein YjcR